MENTLAFQVNGKLVKFPATVGEEVKKGDILAQLDLSDFQFDKEHALAELTASRLNYKRVLTLIKTASVSQKQYENEIKNYQVAQTEYKIASKAYNDASITAP